MHLLKAVEGRFCEHRVEESAATRGLAGWLLELRRWWRERTRAEQRRKAKRRLFLLESLTLGPKQRVVLMRCGTQRYLVGLGADGIRAIVPVDGKGEQQPTTGNLVAEPRWG